MSLTDGPYGFWYPSTGHLSVVVFWCGADNQLTVMNGRVVCA